MKFLEQIFSVKNNDIHKVINILGIRIKLKDDSLKNKQLLTNNLEKIKNNICTLLNETLTMKNFLSDNISIPIKKNPNFGWWKNDWLDFITPGKTFEKAYLNLIKNTDTQSINLVNRIINDMRYYNENKKTPCFSEEEAKKIKQIENIHKSRILQLSNELFSYEKYFLPINYFETGIFYEKYSIDEFSQLDKIRQGNIVDAGAFIGDSSIILAQYTDNKVYAFEPVKENYELLLKTITINSDLQEHIVPVNLALSDKISEINISVNGQCSSAVNSVSDYSEHIKTTTLDDFVQQNNLKISLIKTDVEGFEQNLLRGAQNTICEQKPALLISMYHGCDDFFNIKPLIESWGLGYKFKIRKPQIKCISNGTLLIAEIDN